MAWYWIVACVVGYFLIGSIIAAVREYILYGKANADLDDFSAAIVFVWPFVGALCIVFGVPYVIYLFACFVVKLFVKLFKRKPVTQKSLLD